MNAPRSWTLLLGLLGAGLFVSPMVPAQNLQAPNYRSELMVPAFVKDVRKIVITAATHHKWQILEDSPGLIRMELRHEREQALLIANTAYGSNFIRIQLERSAPLSCPAGAPCEVAHDHVQRWLINLRREYSFALLNAAIVNAGGTVVDETQRKARFRSPEQSLAAPSPTEVAVVAQDLFRERITGERYFDLAAERLSQLVVANAEERQKAYESAIEWLGMALAKAGDGRYRDVLATVAGHLKGESIRRKYSDLLAKISSSSATQYRVGGVTLPDFVDNYAEGLRSSNPLFAQNVAIMMLEAGEKRHELFELSAIRIEMDRHDSNRYVASASAHLCRFLITSNDPRHADLYRSLVDLSANGSLRNAAKDGLLALGQWKK